MGIPTFLGLNSAVSALDAMTQGQSVVANNIANQNTQGYVQENANLTELGPYPPVGQASAIHGQIGQGVTVGSVTRQTDAFITQQDRLNQGTYQMYSTHSSGLTQIQSILNEPSSNSLQNALDQFFASWQTLSGNPADTAARQSVISQAQMLGQTFATVTRQLEQLQMGLQSTIEGSPSYNKGAGQLTVGGTSTTPSSTSPIATDVETLNAPKSLASQFQLKFTATGTSLGTPTYTVQLETNDSPPQAIGSPVPVTGAGTYTIGDASSLLVSAQVSSPGSLVPSGTTLAAGDTYTQTDAFSPPSGQLAQFNQYAYQVDQLNQQIVKVNAAGQNPNALLDQRGVILDNMSQMVNISYTPSPDGAVSVSVGSQSIVSAGGGVTALTQAGLGQVDSGSIAGNQASVSDTSSLLTQLDQFLTNFATQVNAIQTNGYGVTSSGMGATSTAPPMFDMSTDSSGNVVLSLHSTTTPPASPVYITSTDVSASGSPGQAGDNSNALKMAALQNQSGVYNNGTFDQGLAQMVSNVGIEANATTAAQKTASSLAQQSSSMRQSISGVDANQQEALMVEYQNSYNAAAKFIGVFDGMLQTLISSV